MKIELAPGQVAAFVYGTLRPQGNPPRSWGMDGTETVLKNWYIDGNLYFVSGRTSYPVAKLDEPGRIVGDIILFDDISPQWQHICDVEIGAGYELREVEAGKCAESFAISGDIDFYTVHAWHYVHPVRGRIPVPDNNWLRAVNSRKVNK